ncbi:MAG: hypothetical protein Hyperionvirus9_35 [Hyperionvirus sp.]|uniref:Uncharacterized protein n=1 Tax=Hyperionvirus sp. TaxID=2487770 RepID=A0A3G5A8P6_9VIRU|nr:MAG: hypothetical protein Hyperionvirus9_35 [Hyperionvirus sp.]
MQNGVAMLLELFVNMEYQVISVSNCVTYKSLFRNKSIMYILFEENKFDF